MRLIGTMHAGGGNLVTKSPSGWTESQPFVLAIVAMD